MSGAGRLKSPGTGGGGRKSTSGNVKVSVRIRPLNRRELAANDVITWDWTQNSMELRDQDATPTTPSSPPKRRSDPPRTAFTFDHLFKPDADNDDVYRDIGRHVVNGAFEGFHSSIFAYGQTSTGKTHTMLGSGARITGILGHAVSDVFEMIRDSPDREYLLRVSFMEIYNEALNDLLVPTSTNLVIFEHSKKGCVVRGLLEEVVTTEDRILELVTSGLRHRKVGSTNYNAKSSRSHTIFRMIIESKPKGQTSKKGSVRISTLSMIDLAGSESLKLSGAKGARKAEGGYINKSLLTLGKIIYKLSSKSDPNMHVPYRDSKLTRILQSSLKGNSKISIVCCVTPGLGCVDETVNTLKFAARAKKIKHVAIVNEVEDSHALLHRYKKEIEDLKKQLQMYQQQPQKSPSQPRTSAEQLVEEKDKRQLQKIIKQLNDMIIDSEKLSVTSPSAGRSPTTDEDGVSRGRRGSESVLSGGVLGEDSLAQPHTPNKDNGNGNGNAKEPVTASARRSSLATSKNEMQDIKAALEMLMERATKGGEPASAQTHSGRKLPLPPPPGSRHDHQRVAALQKEVEQLKLELAEKETIIKECYALIDTAVQNQEDLTKQHEEIMGENEKLREEAVDLRGIAEAASEALEAVEENETLKKELRRYKKICESREKELLKLKGVSPEAESF